VELVKITHPADLHASDVDEIAAILDEAGIAALLTPPQKRKGSLTIDPWTVIVTATSVAYLNAFGKELGEKTPAALARLARHVLNHRPKQHPHSGEALIVEIEDRHMVFVFPAYLVSDPAAKQQADKLINDPAALPGIYQWDTYRQRWVLRGLTDLAGEQRPAPGEQVVSGS